jgi:hypothetical protein
MTETLLKQVKRKLNITWDDPDTNDRVQDLIESAEIDLKHKLGITAADFDFSEPGTENLLFLAFCLYEWNHASHEFDVNYARMIAQVQEKNEVEHYRAQESEAQADE